MKTEIFKYKYAYDKHGYTILYGDKVIGGQSLNVSLMDRRPNYLDLEYHRQEAKKLMLVILRSHGKN